MAPLSRTAESVSDELKAPTPALPISIVDVAVGIVLYGLTLVFVITSMAAASTLAVLGLACCGGLMLWRDVTAMLRGDGLAAKPSPLV